MQKVAEMFAKNAELTLLARIHRVTSHTIFGDMCALLFKLNRLITMNDSQLQANIWLLEHMKEFVQQRFDKNPKHESTNDLLQLMMNAVHSDKVCYTEFLLIHSLT